MAGFVNRPGMRHVVPLAEQSGDESSFVAPALWDGETIDFSLNNVKFAWDAESSPESGILFITSKRVIWIGQTKAYDFDVPYITLHAVSKDPSCYPLPCVFCQLDEEEDTEEEHTQMFLAPEDEADVYRIFDAFSHAALLNPDEEDDDEGEDDFIFNEEEVHRGAQEAMLAAWESKFVAPDEENDADNCYDEDEEDEEDEAEDMQDVAMEDDEADGEDGVMDEDDVAEGGEGDDVV